jgi:hypothetical protein
MYKLGIGNDQVIHRTGFSSDITDHAYLSQVHVSGNAISAKLLNIIVYIERDYIRKCRRECSHEGRQGRCIRLFLRKVW